MVEPPHLLPQVADVLVVGAGLNGAAAALAFASAGFATMSIGADERLFSGRTVALFGRSIELMKRLGVWDEAEARGAPLRALRIIDDTGSLFAPSPVEFQAREIGLEAFGWNLQNNDLADILAARIRLQPNLTRSDSRVARFSWLGDAVELIDESGFRYAARLVVGADGKGSPTRKAAGISISSHAYGQSALTLFLKHTRAHDDVSTEFHTREGPFTLVPLPSAPDAPHRSSLVWMMSEAEALRRMALEEEKLTREIERQSRGVVGSLTIEGDRGLFPMTRQRAARLTALRVALIGDAAHVYPPIGAQGLNLGLRDVEDLLSAIKWARKKGGDIGSAPTLSAYERTRALDVAERMIAVNGLNASLTANLAPVDALRGLGLTTLGLIGPLRRLVMREGLSPQWARAAP